MKKILWLCPLMLLMMAFIGCDDKEKTVDETSKYLVVGPL